ncbi:hypothetical protein C8F04DRAFT_1131640 [Mycena alexandri]|uniref:F-box domain-containing protein n=1 Tax=Mycena alexandri TaxID=1745969 RepID=A0AAD6SF81_9AGAR|nr:hypothetical protein C8F04DRAFT_1131640 [Mycena alexandri]
MTGQPARPLIFCLPDDLLIEVAAALHHDQQLYPNPDRGLKAEWVLSRVSQRFQHVILHARELWTVIEVELQSNGSMNILQLYLERSGAYAIWLTVRDSLSLQSSSRLVQCLNYILPHLGRIWQLNFLARLTPISPHGSPRLSRLDVMYKLAFWDKLVSTLKDLAAPKLRRLSLELDDGSINGGFISDVELFTLGVPLLTHLTISGFTPSIPHLDFLKNITHLEMWHCRVVVPVSFTKHLQDIVASCPALLSLAVDVRAYEISGVHAILSLPGLRALRLWCSTRTRSEYLPGLLATFDAPSLETLTIAHGHAMHVRALFGPWPGGTPRASFPVLSSLTFIGLRHASGDIQGGGAESAMVPPLHLFPAMSTLNLIHQHGTVQLIRALWGPNAQKAWPSLRTLMLCPRTEDVGRVGGALTEARRTETRLPRLTLSAALRDQTGMEVELFDPADIMRACRCL